MRPLFAFCLLCLVPWCQTEPIPSSRVSKTSHKRTEAESLIDRIVDLALKRVQEKTVEPIKLQDEVIQFKKKVLLIPINGELILYNGKLWGIRSIKRHGDTVFTTNHTEILVNATVQFDVISFTYTFQADLYNLSTSGTIHGNITNLVADAGLTINIRHRNITLERLKLVTAKSMSLQINSSKYIDAFINYILKAITSIFKTAILGQIEKELKSYLGYTIHFNVAT